MDFKDFGLGRCEPPDFEHVEKYPYTAASPLIVEKLLVLPRWHTKHNQGSEGACVGFGTSMMLTIVNEQQLREGGKTDAYIRYNPWWLWDRAKEVDVWPTTNPGDSNGTSVRAACDILKKSGHVFWPNSNIKTSISGPFLKEGIKVYRWARTIDEVRACIYEGKPVSIGVNWYQNFDRPVFYKGEYWIGKSSNLGLQRGGHCVCVYGASDTRQAVRIKNSWGAAYPEVWMPYTTLERLIRENGEVAIITDL